MLFCADGQFWRSHGTKEEYGTMTESNSDHLEWTLGTEEQIPPSQG